jgi:undecaprenyl-diphosphatase
MIRSMRLPNDPAIPIGPPWLREAGRDLTALGGSTVLALMIFVVAGYLFLQKKYHAMWVTLICTTGGLAVSLVLKRIFSRPRPTEVPHLSETMTSSFPSGHSMLSAVVYLTLGMLLTRVVAGRASKIYFLGIAMVITFLVGVSRVYLGVHYPTDVMAGWMAGFVWALLCWMVTRYLQHRGQVEPPSHDQT